MYRIKDQFKSMQRFKFNSVEEIEQHRQIWENGVLIAERKVSYYTIYLYQVESFYIEVYYHSHFNVITKVRRFSNTSLLQPYLQNISIDSLLK